MVSTVVLGGVSEQLVHDEHVGVKTFDDRHGSHARLQSVDHNFEIWIADLRQEILHRWPFLKPPTCTVLKTNNEFLM